jgi:serine/threonine protein kinase
MNCPSEDQLACFVDGALAEVSREAMVLHLSSCEDCRAVLSDVARAMTDELEPANTAPGRAPMAPATPSRMPSFTPGALIGERYRVVRHIAEGGMGEVYEVEDLELHARIALKTVRSEIASEAINLDRFKREIYLARKVTHPNVCRIFDVGFHATEQRRVTFFTMEYLEGENLAARIARGRMHVDEAAAIAQQLIAGLASAHQAEVVHRDFKSANVMLVSRGGATRAVITDFGLARGAAGDHFGFATTNPGGLVGSPAYMAPEQVAGLEVTGAADVYALGVVLFEMVTGRWPFVGETAMLTAVRRLHEPPPSPSRFAPAVPVRWEAAILRCLARDPEERFARLEDLAEALRPTTEPGRMPQRAALALAVVSALGAIGLWASRPVTRRSAVAVPAPSTPAMRPTSVGAPTPRSVVSISIDTRPPDAALTLDGVAVANPFTQNVTSDPRVHHVEARAHGFRSATQLVAFDTARRFTIELAPRPSPHEGGHARPDPALDHFILDYPDARRSKSSSSR